MPRRAVNTPPVSAPVNPPSPAPLLCKTTLVIRAIDVIIRAMSKKVSTRASGMSIQNVEISRWIIPLRQDFVKLDERA